MRCEQRRGKPRADNGHRTDAAHEYYARAGNECTGIIGTLAKILKSLNFTG